MGFEVKEEYIDENRKDILILNTENAKIFLERIEKYKTSAERLRVFLQQSRKSNDDSWYYDFRSSLYVNFDTCKLFSIYSEPASFEEYVPLNWEGKYFDFMGNIPIKERYWIDEENNNLLVR